MSEYTIYHNPRCSKSRATLLLLEEHGVLPNVILYLDDTPTVDQLREICRKLDRVPGQLLRKGEDAYKASGLDADSTEEAILQAMIAHPKLLERPIVVRGNHAVVGRPPENVLGLIDA
jgi:arsenate reductase